MKNAYSFKLYASYSLAYNPFLGEEVG